MCQDPLLPPRPERWSVGLRLLLKLQYPAARELPISGCSGSSGGCFTPLYSWSQEEARRRRTGAPVLTTEVWRNFSSRKETGSGTARGLFPQTCGHGIRVAEESQAFGLRKETTLSLASRQLAGLQRAKPRLGRPEIERLVC